MYCYFRRYSQRPWKGQKHHEKALFPDRFQKRFFTKNLQAAPDSITAKVVPAAFASPLDLLFKSLRPILDVTRL